MRQANGDLWTLPSDAICITTNFDVKKNGDAVMGRGCALQAAKMWPTLPAVLGDALNVSRQLKWLGANYPLMSAHGPTTWTHLISYPVKYHWYDKADVKLIEKSAHELMTLVVGMAFHNVLLPRPGCGNGQLQWADVKPIIAPILDDRVIVVDFAVEDTRAARPR